MTKIFKANKLAFIYSIILLSILAMILFLISLITGNSIKKRFYTKQEEISNIMINRFKDNALKLESEVIHISYSSLLSDFLISGDLEIKKDIEKYFSRLLLHNIKQKQPVFDHVRLLDLNGVEVVRVNLLNDNKTIDIVDDDRLQDKSEYFYFKEIQKITSDEIYISSVDLNIENHKIEKPYKPIIRISCTIEDETGSIIGYLILNQRFNDILVIIDKAISDKTTWALANNNGYYLKNIDNNKTFGFMFENGQDNNVKNDYPKLWKNIEHETKNYYRLKDDILFFKRFCPYSKTKLFICDKEFLLILKIPIELYNSEFKLLYSSIIIGFILLSPILILFAYLYARSVIKNREYINDLRDAATHDEMTGLLNSRAFRSKLDYLVKLNKRSFSPLTLIFIDLNNLKVVNDTLGHDKGDILITSLSSAIEQSLRGTDLAARIGGDEFLICLPQMDYTNTNILIDRINLSFLHNCSTVFNFKCSFSHGVSQWRVDGDDIDNLIKRADEQMYEMKKNRDNLI